MAEAKKAKKPRKTKAEREAEKAKAAVDSPAAPVDAQQPGGSDPVAPVEAPK